MDKDHNCMNTCIGSVRTPMSALLWRPSQCFCNHSKQMQNILPLQIESHCWVLKQTLSGSLAQGMKLLRLAKGAVRNSRGRVLLSPGTRPPTSPRRSGEKIGFILGGFHIKHPDFSWLPPLPFCADVICGSPLRWHCFGSGLLYSAVQKSCINFYPTLTYIWQ